MKRGGLTADERPRLGQLGELIREESARHAGQPAENQQPARVAVAEAEAVGEVVVHTWTFECDTPRLTKGEMPMWRVVNINHALEIESGRQRQPELGGRSL